MNMNPSFPLSVHFTILGECASKANSRKLVTIAGKSRFIKSDKARAFFAHAQQQAKLHMIGLHPMAGRLKFTADIYYATERPDLDESLLLDALQGIVYTNDRQVREKHIRHHIDRAKPRAVVSIVVVADPKKYKPSPENEMLDHSSPDIGHNEEK